MTADDRRKRKVVAGSHVFFEDDLKINEAPLSEPLRLPPLAPPQLGELTLLYRDQLFHLAEHGDGPDRMTLCGLSFSFEKIATVHEIEEEYLRTHADAIAVASREFLCSLHPALIDSSGAIPKTARTAQAATSAIDRLRLITAAEGDRPARPALPGGTIRPPAEPSVLLAVLPGYDRSLFVDGRRHDLLTTAEFLESWKRGFHPDMVREVLDRPTPWKAQELADFLQKKADLANPRALSAVCAGLHTRHRPITFTIDGFDLIPVPQREASVFLNDWTRVLGRETQRRALQELI